MNKFYHKEPNQVIYDPFASFLAFIREVQLITQPTNHRLNQAWAVGGEPNKLARTRMFWPPLVWFGRLARLSFGKEPFTFLQIQLLAD